MNYKKLFINFSLIAVLFSCSDVSTINMRNHSYNLVPDRYIWIQVAGLDHEHIAMLKFDKNSVEDYTSFENSMCTGQGWTYNLFKLRPGSNESMISQITGSKNSKDDCSQYGQEPIWNYFSKHDYQTAVIEFGGDNSNSIIKSLNCKQKNFLKKTSLFISTEDAVVNDRIAKTYHPQSVSKINESEVLKDASCLKGSCFHNLFENAASIYKVLSEESSHFILIRDFSYLNALKKNDFKEANKILSNIEKLYKYFQSLEKAQENLLVIVTSGAPVEVEFPKQGFEWRAFKQENKNLKLRNISLVSPVYAFGARSENFCGLYEEASLFRRFLRKGSEEKDRFRFNFLNPFDY